ncbi:MAG: epoxide hydrolase [Anaerolineae bacterium]|nr:epoxide hydrolase [Anaerolineae bacterium]
MTVIPFQIAIPQSALDDLHQRLRLVRWPDAEQNTGWGMGTSLDYLKELTAYWQSQYDWRAHETQLNQFNQFVAEIDGSKIHFIHERGQGPKPKPLLLLHGWPDSFYRFHKVIPLLTDPARFGGSAEDSFDVIIPSLPGFGFSSRPTEADGMRSTRTADLLAKLMTDELGYERYLVAGGDIGARITRLLALNYPAQVEGIHLTDIGFPRDISFPAAIPDPLPVEQQFMGATQFWFVMEGAYAAVQSSRPQTLAFALNDSPVGLAAWIIDKFRAWSDCGGNLEQCFSKDELLTNIMIYWLTETISSSMRLYFEDGRTPPQIAAGQRIEVPAAVTLFPKDFTRPPREIAARFLQVRQWTEMERGGHFAALEAPTIYSENLRAFARML